MTVYIIGTLVRVKMGTGGENFSSTLIILWFVLKSL